MSYQGPSLASDVVALSVRRGRLEVLLIRRRRDPFQGLWAIPGGFVEEGEDLPLAARREFREETGLEARTLHLLGVYSAPDRDPRRHVASTIYLAPFSPDASEPKAGDDAAEAAWYPFDDAPPLAFDHTRILGDARIDLRRRVETAAFGLRLAPAPFTADELRILHEAALARPVDGEILRRNYAAAGLLVDAGPGRYRVDDSALERVEARGFLAGSLDG